MLTLRIEFHRPILAMLFIAASIAFGTVDASTDKGVTLYLYSDKPVSFDLQKVAKKAASTLSKEGISVIAIDKVDKQSLPGLLTRFVVGESAKLKIKITPGTTIKGSPLSSYPATITVDVIGIASPAAITSITKRARSQHTNPSSGLTNAIRIALGPVLTDLSGQLNDLEPWSRNSTVIATSDDNNPPSNDTTSLSSGTATQIVKIPEVGSALVPALGNCRNKSVTPYSLTAIPETLKPGNRVRIISCYSIRSDQTAKTTITTTISSPTGENIKVKEDSLMRTFGYWKAEFDMKVPEKFTPGIYTLTQIISFQGNNERLEKKLIIE
jgi:hypothetical protein